MCILVSLISSNLQVLIMFSRSPSFFKCLPPSLSLQCLWWVKANGVLFLLKLIIYASDLFRSVMGAFSFVFLLVRWVLPRERERERLLMFSLPGCHSSLLRYFYMITELVSMSSAVAAWFSDRIIFWFWYFLSGWTGSGACCQSTCEDLLNKLSLISP